MKIYWECGKEINILLYIDRIIFIKIHIHVQVLVWSRVLCGAAEKWAQRTGSSVPAGAAGGAWGHRN